MAIIFRADARAEFDNALEYFARRAPAAAASFLEDYERVAIQLQHFPNSDKPLARNARRILSPRFPYQLIYRIEADDIVVYAIAHQKQRPGYWRKRMDSAR